MIMKFFWISEAFICCLILYRLWLGGKSNNKTSKQKTHFVDDNTSELVCIQLPLFNEKGQILALLESICKQDWPRFKIQVLDDSDCIDCIAETQDAVAHYRKKFPHLDITLLKRPQRLGFKAGALNHGLTHELVATHFAIFDCDFRPSPTFISKLMPEFKCEQNVAAVQAPWSYLNPNENVLTKIQTLVLGTHFFLEHKGRQERRWVLNFNGTAGIWSRHALEALGGWSDRTVTEDLLLSYKAELLGMRIRFTEVAHCPSELPARFSSFLVQQKRWARGHGQVLRLLSGAVLKNKTWTLSKKLDALFHLNSYNISVIISLLMLLLPFWITARSQFISSTNFLNTTRLADSALWIISLFLFTKLYASKRIHSPNALPFIERVKNSIVFALHTPFISFVVMESYLKGLYGSPQKSATIIFQRTPKNSSASSKNWNSYVKTFAPVFVITSYLFFLGIYCFVNALWIAGSVFALQSVCGMGLCLRELVGYKHFFSKTLQTPHRHERPHQESISEEVAV